MELKNTYLGFDLRIIVDINDENEKLVLLNQHERIPALAYTINKDNGHSVIIDLEEFSKNYILTDSVYDNKKHIDTIHFLKNVPAGTIVEIDGKTGMLMYNYTNEYILISNTRNYTSKIKIKNIQNQRICSDVETEVWVQEYLKNMQEKCEGINLKFPEKSIDEWLHAIVEMKPLFKGRTDIHDYENIYVEVTRGSITIGHKQFQLALFSSNMLIQEFKLPKVHEDTIMNIIETKSAINALANTPYNNIRYCYDTDIFKKVKDVQICLSDPKFVTYTPADKKKSTDNLKKHTQKMSLYKFLQGYLKGYASEYEIKCIGDEIVAKYTDYDVVEVDKSQLYSVIRNTGGRSWNTTSCMKEKPPRYFDIYLDNDNVQLFVIKQGDEIVGRFFKMNAVNAKDKSKVVFADRLYYKDETVLRFFYSWCDKNNLTRRLRQGMSKTTEFYQNGKILELELILEIVKPVEEYNLLPYLDTFRYAPNNQPFLTNVVYPSKWVLKSSLGKKILITHVDILSAENRLEFDADFSDLTGS